MAEHQLSHDAVVETIYIGLTTLPDYLKTHVRKIGGRDLKTDAIAELLAARLDNGSSKVMVTGMVGFNTEARRAAWDEGQ